MIETKSGRVPIGPIGRIGPIGTLVAAHLLHLANRAPLHLANIAAHARLLLIR